jgi:hypothetical protein
LAAFEAPFFDVSFVAMSALSQIATGCPSRAAIACW